MTSSGADMSVLETTLDMNVDQVGIGIGIEIDILFPDLRYLVGILVYILFKCVENSLTLKFHHDQAPGS